MEQEWKDLTGKNIKTAVSSSVNTWQTPAMMPYTGWKSGSPSLGGWFDRLLHVCPPAPPPPPIHKHIYITPGSSQSWPHLPMHQPTHLYINHHSSQLTEHPAEVHDHWGSNRTKPGRCVRLFPPQPSPEIQSTVVIRHILHMYSSPCSTHVHETDSMLNGAAQLAHHVTVMW